MCNPMGGEAEVMNLAEGVVMATLVVMRPRERESKDAVQATVGY